MYDVQVYKLDDSNAHRFVSEETNVTLGDVSRLIQEVLTQANEGEAFDVTLVKRALPRSRKEA
jgi:hypothetical protein